jgi:hypothetical protein
VQVRARAVVYDLSKIACSKKFDMTIYAMTPQPQQLTTICVVL